MNTVVSESELDQRVERDQRNAAFAVETAKDVLTRIRPPRMPVDSRFGLTEHDRSRLEHSDRSRVALEAIADQPVPRDGRSPRRDSR